MTIVHDPNGKAYALDGYIYESFSMAKTIMQKKDVDLPILVTGYPGTGKSTLIMQIATFLDPTFNETRMCQTVEDFIEQIKNSTKRQAIVLDESYAGLNASEVRREVGRAFLNLLNIVRQKNLYIFIILPNFFDMAKQVAVFRTRWLIHCYDKGFGDIGYFCLFDRNTKHNLYIKGKKFEDYNCVKADFFGRFSAFIPTQINYDKYLSMKLEGLNKVGEVRKSINKFELQRDKLILYMHKILNVPRKEICQLLGVNQEFVYEIIQKYKPKENEEKQKEMVNEFIENELKNPLIKKRFINKE